METYKLTFIDKRNSQKTFRHCETWIDLLSRVRAMKNNPDFEILLITRIVEKELKLPQQKEIQELLTPTWQHD